MKSMMLSTMSAALESYTIKGVLFRPLARCDAFPLFDATRNPDFNRHLLWSAPETEQQAPVQVDKLIRQNTLQNVVAQSICKKSTGEWLGYLLFKPFKDGVELGIALHPRTWNTRLTLTAITALIQTTIDALPGTPIYSRVLPANKRMRKICLFYGFELAGEAKELHTTTGDPMNFDVFLLNQGSWKTIRDGASY
jgi:RimJ/RimL family protein N-acetyltransferase